MNETPLTDNEVVIERHDLEIMRRTHLWSFGSFLQLKHQVAVDSHGISRTAILYHFNAHPKQKQRYVFLPETNIYNIPDEFWTNAADYRSGGETLLFEIIMEGWIVG
jgi:hypothetical protein